MTTPPPVPAGWYPDPAGSGHTRWWDGTRWTENLQAPYAVASAPAVLRAPEGTKPYTVWIWLIVGLLALLIVPVLLVDQRAVLEQQLGSAPPTITPGEIVQALAGWVGAVLYVLFAYFDVRALRARGVPRPFHWAWMFFALITPLVYIIGRSVVARRRTGSGLAPIWASIVVCVVWLVVYVAFVAVPAGQIATEILSGTP